MVLYGNVAANALESRQLGESVCGKSRLLDGQRPDGRAASSLKGRGVHVRLNSEVGAAADAVQPRASTRRQPKPTVGASVGADVGTCVGPGPATASASAWEAAWGAASARRLAPPSARQARG